MQKTKKEQLLECLLNQISFIVEGEPTPAQKAEWIQQGIERNKILALPREPIDSLTDDRLNLEFGEKLNSIIGAVK